MPFGVDDALMIGAGLAGAAGGFFGGGSGGGTQKTSMNQTVTQSPWSGISPYLTGGTMPDGTPVPGIFPEAGRLYNQSGWTPEMQRLSQDLYNDTFNNRAIAMGSGIQNVGGDFLKGYFDPNVTAAGQINGPTPITPDKTTLMRAREGQGELDPTNALKDFLAGTSANPWVEKQSKAITDFLTRNTLEEVMPAIRSGAIEAGQYGSNRQAQAEAKAISRLNTDLAPALTQLGGSAYEAEQNRKYGVATGLNEQAERFADANANRALRADEVNARNLLDTQMFNTGTTLNNNAQEMQRAAQVAQNRGAGFDFLSGAQDLTNMYSGDMLRSLNLPSDFDWGNLGRYAGIIQPSADLFKTVNTTGTSTTTGGGGGAGGGIAGAVGGAAAGLGLANSVFGPNGIYGGLRYPGNSPAGAAAPWGGTWY